MCGSRTGCGFGVRGRPDPQNVGRISQVSSAKPSDLVCLRIIAEILHPLALHDPFVIVQSQQRDGHPPHRRFTGETSSFQRKMIFPSIRAGIEEAGKLTGLRDDRTDVRAFGAIAAGAGQREVRSLRPTSVFPTDHMVHFAAGQQGPLGRRQYSQRSPARAATSRRSAWLMFSGMSARQPRLRLGQHEQVLELQVVV
jgi:hypothetical protein